MKIEILGAHNSETDKARLPSLLVDDVIALDAGGLTSSLSLQRQHQITSVLLTHHHFDHTRDLVTLGSNDTHPPSTVDVYGLPATLEVVYKYLLDGKMYKDYTQWPKVEAPRLLLKALEAYRQLVIAGCVIIPVPVNHSVPSVGFLVTSRSGRSFFYTGDTGPGLSGCWEHISPEVLFIEITGLNSMGDAMRGLGHLTPDLLVEELQQFQKLKGYLPRVIAAHVSTLWEDKLRAELAVAGQRLGKELEVGHEGLTVEL
ncbi:MAG: MBL fold metallo-hydrolase [Dehalococcoidia bacterium]|jgi:cAMP phosphodiesterase